MDGLPHLALRKQTYGEPYLLVFKLKLTNVIIGEYYSQLILFFYFLELVKVSNNIYNITCLICFVNINIAHPRLNFSIRMFKFYR